MPLTENGREVLIRARQRTGELQIERFADVAFVPMRGVIRTPTECLAWSMIRVSFWSFR